MCRFCFINPVGTAPGSNLVCPCKCKFSGEDMTCTEDCKHIIWSKEVIAFVNRRPVR